MCESDARLVFVLPDCHEELSGGHHFNRGLLEGLNATGAVEVCTWSEARALHARPGRYLVDSLNLCEFDARWSTRGQRYVLLVHHLPSLEPGANADVAQEVRMLGRFDAFIATSAFTERYLRELGCTQPVVTIEPVLGKLPRGQGGPEFPLRALMSCNLIPRKGVLELLEELAEGTLPKHRFKLSIVGRMDMDREYSEACAKRIATSAELCKRVTLQGAVRYEQMPQRYQQANLFLSASRMETFGISLQEARWFALPILAVQGGNSANHVKQGVTGAVYATSATLAQGFLALSQDVEQMRRYSEGAQEYRLRETESWSEAADRLRAALAQIG